MDLKLVFLQALAEPEYSRVEFWQIKQKESGYSENVFWLKLNDYWQWYSDKINGELVQRNAIGNKFTDFLIPLLTETQGAMRGNIGLDELRLLFSCLMEFGIKNNLIEYQFEYDFSNIQLAWNQSPYKNYKLLQILKENAFVNELSKKDEIEIPVFLEYHFRCFKRKNGNLTEWLNSTKKLLPKGVTPQQKDIFYSWFESKDDKQETNNESQILHAIPRKSRLEFTGERLKKTILELANLNGYETPSTYLDELLCEVKKFNDKDFEMNFFLNVHHICNDNVEKFWSQSHRENITKWLSKAKFVTDVFKSTWESSSAKIEKIKAKQENYESSPTLNIVKQEFEILDKIKGWEYAFINEGDYNKFISVLSNFFEAKSVAIPTVKLSLKRGCKTRLAPVFNSLYKQLKMSETPLKTDREYFNIIRILEPFSNLTDTELYKAITR